MSSTVVGFAYLVAAVLFILSLKGLSHPETARRGNVFGIAGMVIAVVTTLLQSGVSLRPLNDYFAGNFPVSCT